MEYIILRSRNDTVFNCAGYLRGFVFVLALDDSSITQNLEFRSSCPLCFFLRNCFCSSENVNAQVNNEDGNIGLFF